MIPYKDYYECPLCRNKCSNTNKEEYKKDYKNDLINLLKTDNISYKSFKDIVTCLYKSNPTDSMALLLLPFIKDRVDNRKIELDFENYFSDETESLNFSLIIHFLIDKCNYEELIKLNDCLEKMNLLGNYEQLINKKREKFESDMKNRSLIESDIFICYSKQDIMKVVEIVSALEDNGYTCWYLDRNISRDCHTIDEYKANIENAILNSKLFLVITSKNCMYSHDTVMMMECVINHQYKNRLEYIISSVKHTSQFRQFFEGHKCVDAVSEDKIDELLNSIETILKSESDNITNVELDDKIVQTNNSVQEETEESNLNDNNSFETLSTKDEVINDIFIQLNKLSEETSVKIDDTNDVVENNDEIFEEESIPENDYNNVVTESIDYRKLGINAFDNNEFEKALEYLTKCEEDSDIYYYLGMIYYNLDYQNFNIEKAIEYFMKTDNKAISEIMNDLGKKYYIGKEVQKNPELAFKCFLKSANLGNDKAMCNVALCYNKGQGVDSNQSMSANFYQKAADLGNIKGMYEFANMCLDKNNKVYNPKTAIEYFTKAANKNYVDAQYSLGVCYYHGYGVNINYTKSIEWIDAAIKNGSKAAAEFKKSKFGNNLNLNNEDCALELDDYDDSDD